MTCAGDAHEDETQLLTHALSAQHLQREVSEAASRAAGWWQQQTPAAEQAQPEALAVAAPGLDQAELCRLCLLPTEVVQLPALQLESGKQCLVSATSVNALYISMSCLTGINGWSTWWECAVWDIFGMFLAKHPDWLGRRMH